MNFLKNTVKKIQLSRLKFNEWHERFFFSNALPKASEDNSFRFTSCKLKASPRGLGRIDAFFQRFVTGRRILWRIVPENPSRQLKPSWRSVRVALGEDFQNYKKKMAGDIL